MAEHRSSKRKQREGEGGHILVLSGMPVKRQKKEHQRFEQSLRRQGNDVLSVDGKVSQDASRHQGDVRTFSKNYHKLIATRNATHSSSKASHRVESRGVHGETYAVDCKSRTSNEIDGKLSIVNREIDQQFIVEDGIPTNKNVHLHRQPDKIYATHEHLHIKRRRKAKETSTKRKHKAARIVKRELELVREILRRRKEVANERHARRRCFMGMKLLVLVMIIAAFIAHKSLILSVPLVDTTQHYMLSILKAMFSFAVLCASILTQVLKQVPQICSSISAVSNMSTGERMCIVVQINGQELNSGTSHHEIDKHATFIARNHIFNHDLHKLVHTLTKPFNSKDAKARAVFRFVAEWMKYDDLKAACIDGQSTFEAKRMCQGHLEKMSPQTILVKRTGVCADYAKLTEAMLVAAGVPARYLSGQSMPQKSDMGRPHAWNAFKGDDGRWKLIDVTWADGGHTVDERYWCPKPDHHSFHCPLVVMKEGEKLPFVNTSSLAKWLWTSFLLSPFGSDGDGTDIVGAFFALSIAWLVFSRRKMQTR
eukprot:CAMPEP_0184498368 /NCGR_PEP_ID=MMETSP0113_2-20130426/38753_1 /TAXON_ID=91329 /ORGANISM="Norrisiella sphaerica, Strain BC52" /LENGTH=537 /DNA_ID=CAMNT_0026885837 /DNA_START=163 /DNA_END=1773 /DNA_ORIENTATION=-